MNYFELFGIPVQLSVEKKELPERFFRLSRQYHPDYFVNHSPVEQSIALERSAQLNKAYKTFQDPGETIKYVLQLKGLQEEEEKYELPPDFLMEVMEINEQLMDAGSNDKIKNLETEIYEPVKNIIENYKEDHTTTEELLQVKEYYYKKKYLERIKRRLKDK